MAPSWLGSDFCSLAFTPALLPLQLTDVKGHYHSWTPGQTSTNVTGMSQLDSLHPSPGGAQTGGSQGLAGQLISMN